MTYVDPLYALQDHYLSTGEGLDAIYLELVRLSHTVLRSLMKSKGLSFPPEKQDQICHDCSTNFIEYTYLTNSTKIEAFYTVCRYYMYQQLGWVRRGRFSKQKHWDRLEPIIEDCSTVEPDYDDPTDRVREYADKSLWIPYYLYKSKTFKSAIEQIIKVGGPQWTRNNWNHLYETFRILKRSGRSDSLRIYCRNLKKSADTTTCPKLKL